MGLSTQQLADICNEYGKDSKDTGLPEVQIALFTARIKFLTEYLKTQKKDYATKRSLVKMVGKRKSQLDYIKSKDIERYRTIVKKLELRAK